MQMSTETITAEIAAILSDWQTVADYVRRIAQEENRTPPPMTPNEEAFAVPDARGWLIHGVYGRDYYNKHTGRRPDSPDTPDDPLGAARWLDAHAKERAAAQEQAAKETPHAPPEENHLDRDRSSRSAPDRDDPAAEAGVQPAPGDAGPGRGGAGVGEQGETLAAEEAALVAELVEDEPQELGAEILDADMESVTPSFSGTMINDTLSRLAAEVDAEGKSRIAACGDVMRNTPLSEIANARMLGLVTETMIEQEAAYNVAFAKRIAIADTSAEVRQALAAMTPEALARFAVDQINWPT